MAQAWTEPSPRPWWLRSVIILALLLVVAVAAFFVYRRYEPDRLTRQARGFVAKGDYRNAVLTTRRALEINPASQTASRLMAEITEALQIPDALDWRRRVAELHPGSSAEALAWADAALRAGKTISAEQALAAVREPERNSATYQSKAGTLALSSGRWKDAETHYAEALRLDPANELHQYNYATLQLQSSDAAARKHGAETLDRLAKSGRVQLFAHRALITRALRERNFDAALLRSADVLKDPGAQFSDRLTHLELLRQAQKPEFSEALEQTQKTAEADPTRATLLLNWLRLNGLAVQAVQWAATLDASFARNPAFAVAYGECLVAARDWATLRIIAETPWSQQEELRLAFLARVMREEGEAEAAKARWSQAVSVAVKKRETAARLAFLAMQWGWKDEARQILWAAIDSPAPQWALQALHALCHREGDTNGMLRVATKLAELNPENDAARNNVAMLSLLLDRDREKSLATARALHEKSPAHAAFASTYAFALHLTGKTAEGLAVLDKLAPAQLRQPEMAAYYGHLLSATGAEEKARPYRELGKRANLLPEERALFGAEKGD